MADRVSAWISPLLKRKKKALVLVVVVLLVMSLVIGCTDDHNRTVPDEQVGNPADSKDDHDNKTADSDQHNDNDRLNEMEEVVVPFKDSSTNTSGQSYIDPETMVYHNLIYNYSYDMPDSWKGKVEVVETVFDDRMFTTIWMLSESEPRQQYLLAISVHPIDADVLEEDVICKTESHIYSLSIQIALELSKEKNIDLFYSLNDEIPSWQEKVERFKLEN